MGYVEVRAAEIAGDRIARLEVAIPNLPRRIVDRDTAIRWMKDGHSLIPVVRGTPAGALQLVEAGEDDQVYIRTDNAREPADRLPDLPPL